MGVHIKKRSIEQCYEDFVASGLPIGAYAMHEVMPGYWKWFPCKPMPEAILKDFTRKYNAAKRRMEKKTS